MPVVKPDHSTQHKYTSLVYLGFFFVPMIFGQGLPQGWEIAANASALALFLLVYFWSYHLDGFKKMIPVATMIALGLTLAPINTGANVFFPYAAYTASQILSTRHSYVFLFCLLSLIAAASWAFNLHPAFWVIALLITTAVMLAGITDHKVNIANEKLQRTQEEVEQLATVAERERIARDLHDLLGHTLSVIILKSELSNKLIHSQPDKAEQETHDIQSIARNALQQIRSTLNNYRHTRFHEELKALTKSLENAQILIEKNINLPSIPIKYETPLCMILKEAVTNIIRHAKASFCQINLENHGQYIEFSIADNGCGTILQEGNGIRGIRERVAYLNGTVQYQHQQGTKLTVSLPKLES